MCGRFNLTEPSLLAIGAALDAEVRVEHAALHRPRYNIAPSDWSWIVRLVDGRRRVLPAAWGFRATVGRPGPGAAPGTLLFNARAETAGERRSFRDALLARRCVAVASGFYEWSGGASPGRSRPFHFHSPVGDLLLLAALYEEPPTGEPAFAILTTRANEVVAPHHDRMPVLLAHAHLEAWLTAPAASLLAPAPVEMLVATEVSRRVNAVEHDDPACLAPPDDDSAPRRRQLVLFR